MKNEAKGFLQAIRRPNAKVRFVVGSGGVESLFVNNREFSRNEADPELSGIYGRKMSNDVADYIDCVDGARKLLKPETPGSVKYKTYGYIA